MAVKRQRPGFGSRDSGVRAHLIRGMYLYSNVNIFDTDGECRRCLPSTYYAPCLSCLSPVRCYTFLTATSRA